MNHLASIGMYTSYKTIALCSWSNGQAPIMATNRVPIGVIHKIEYSKSFLVF